MQIEHFFSPKSSSKIEHFFSPNSGEDQKKHKVFSKNRTLFSPNLRSAVHPFKLLGGMQMWTILKLLGGIQLNYWGGYIPPGFGTPGFGISVNRIRNSPFTCSISLLIFGMLHSSFFRMTHVCAVRITNRAITCSVRNRKIHSKRLKPLCQFYSNCYVRIVSPLVLVVVINYNWLELF